MKRRIHGKPSLKTLQKAIRLARAAISLFTISLEIIRLYALIIIDASC